MKYVCYPDWLRFRFFLDLLFSRSISFFSISSLKVTFPSRTQPRLPGMQSDLSFMQSSELKSKYLQENVIVRAFEVFFQRR